MPDKRKVMQKGKGSTGREPVELTLKELECLRGICDGKSLKKIADENGHTISTVQTRLGRIMTKLNAGNRASMILIAASLGLIPSPCRSDLSDARRAD